jgi:integrase/recombinase XerD
VGQPTPSRKASETNLREVTRLWIRNGLKPGTVAIYRRWIRAFQRYCEERGWREFQHLSLAEVRQFAEWYARRRRIRQAPTRASARSALYAWSGALGALGVSVPLWKAVQPVPAVPVPIVREFLDYRRRHCGISVGTLRNEQSTSLEFLEFLRQRKRTCRTVRLTDTDAFVARLRRRMGVVAVASQVCSVRAFLRFLHVSGRLRFDLAGSVVRPLLKVDRHPPKALRWSEVQRILRAVDRDTRTGRRNYAILLLMSLYGFGAAEIFGLRLEDVNWDRKTIDICRRKTHSTILLPLLPAAARVLASYLQRSRPKPSSHRQVFLQAVMPHQPLTSSSTIASMLSKYGRQAGVSAGPLGSHVLRHSQATRHIELGTPVKVLGDILGHRHPESTSRYTRSAVHRLRDLPLALPHGEAI